MIPLIDKPNVDAADSDYPYGNIRNNPGNRTGTPVNKLVYADMHQFFERMMAISGITPNGLPDNAYTGFQLFEALLKVLTDKASAGLYTPTITDGLNVTSSSPNALQYMRVDNIVTISGAFTVVVTANSTDTILEIDLPAPSDFASSFQAGGAGIYDEGITPVRIRANNSTNKIRFEFVPPVGSAGNSRSVNFSCTYVIVV